MLTREENECVTVEKGMAPYATSIHSGNKNRVLVLCPGWSFILAEDPPVWLYYRKLNRKKLIFIEVDTSTYYIF